MRIQTSLAAGVVTIATAMATALATAGESHTFIRLEGTTARVAAYEMDGRIGRLYGEPFAHGATPEESADAFLRANAALFGVTPDDLRDRETQRVLYDGEVDRFRFTLVSYDQYLGDVPVFRGEMRLLARNDAGFPLVWANPAVRDVAAFVAPAGRRDARGAMGRAAATAEHPALEIFTTPRLVIWAGVDDMLVEPKVAWEFVGESRDNVAVDYAKWLFLTDANTGAILHAEDQVLHTDVEGSTSALVTQGLGPDDCGPEQVEPMPYSRVNIGGTVAYADGGGDFVIPNGGNQEVTVQSRVWGRWFRVNNETGPEALIEIDVTPPGPAHFLHNEDNDSELTRAEVNAYLHANIARDFILAYNPEYPTIETQTDFTVNVNRDRNCNATYSGSSINFYTSGGGCPNTAYSTVVHHEYGHHLVATGGSGQGQYGEGMSDAMGVLITDDPGLAYGFFGDCDEPLRDADNNQQYPCDGVHACAPLLSGCIWDTRNELLATNPDTYQDILANLAINAVLLHDGSQITPQITIDYLVLDDNDENIFNGTPHYPEIAAGFGRHNMDAPEVCIGDFDNSGGVDFNDVLQLLSAWGPCPNCSEDLDGSGSVDFNDLLLLLANWGPC